jgi:serine/threonine protein kinase
MMKNAGRYEIHGVLGEGGMGIVYRALDPAMNNREVAVKTIKDPQDKAVLQLFKRECGVLASLTHPNIVEIYDIGEVEEGGVRRPYFVMPLLRGVTLQDLINSSSSRLTVERSIQMIVQICKGLHAAHEHQLVHRDLKPSNLFVLSDDSVKVIDFGVAHLANHLTATGLKGTVLYMAPEQVQRKQPSALSDQFSVAVVCYEMLARRHPFSLAGREDLADAILHFKPPPVSDFNPLVSPLVSQVIHKALAKKPHYLSILQHARVL